MRATLTFQQAFDDVCEQLGHTAAQVAANANLQQSLLKLFNRSYQVGYDLPGRGWEDARTGATITPVDRLISYATLGDSREFEVWTADPRNHENRARRVSFTTNRAGILLSEEGMSTVWVIWTPEVVQFVTTAWAAGNYETGDKVLHDGRNYRCITAHTAADFDNETGNWVEMPVLAIMHEFLIQHTHGLSLAKNGQPETGYATMARAKRDLETLAVREMDRASDAAR